MKCSPAHRIAAALLAGFAAGIIIGKLLSTGISVLAIILAGLGIWLILNK